MSKSLKKLVDYITEHPGRNSTEMSQDLKMSRNTVASILKQHEFLFRKEKVISKYGYRNAAIYANVYFILDETEDPILKQKVIKKRFEPSQVKHHPLMRALYGY